jgi:polysaccharide biosynthesis transport protein
MGTMILFGGIGVVLALFNKDVYSARIGVVVRDEANRSVDRLGRFGSQTELKAAQETILEMVQNPETITAALRSIGPADGSVDDSYPTREVVDSTAASAVNLLAPKGSEFGNTEVVYLQTNADSKKRASAFCDAMYESLTEQLRHIRGLRADSVILELTHARDLAKTELDEASARLQEIEMSFGQDLGDLRQLKETIGGDGANRRILQELEPTLQTAELDLQRMVSLETLLREGAKDPNRLLIVGSDMLGGQPSLQRLKDGLIDAQLAASQLAGIYTEENPKRRAANATENEIRSRLQQESLAAIAAMQPQIELQRELVRRLEGRRDQIKKRLDTLAQIRTQYAKIDSEVKSHTDSLAECQKALGDALAARSAAMSTNLISRLGPAQVTEKPIGPGGSMIAGGATVAGLIFGLGVVFLVAPGPTQTGRGRRWSDYLMAGRRDSDRAVPPTEVVPGLGPGIDRRSQRPVT